jgi:predicted nucleic-acid-binding protein
VKALDTNILVRLIARDHPEQVKAAEDILVAGDVLVLPTVLLETEWVLRARYGVARPEIAARFLAVLGQSGVIVASKTAVASAVEAYAQGGDFADLLHFSLAAELGATSFVTFDRGFAQTGRGDRPSLQII